MVGMSRRNRRAGPSSPAMSMPSSDPVKMRAASAWLVAVIVTSAGPEGAFALSVHRRPSLSAR